MDVVLYGVIILGGWTFNVVKEEIYVVEVVNTFVCVSIVSFVVCSTTKNSAYTYTRRIFGYPSKRVAMWICNGSLKTPKHVVLPIPHHLGV